jgi:hypothetical protein
LTVLRALLGVVLLSDVSFRATYREQQTIPVAQAGLTMMNTTFVDDPVFQYFGTGNFWWHFPAMTSYSSPVEPVRCSGKTCQSYFYPGLISLVRFPPGAPSVPDSDSPLSTTIIQKNAPGYQMDFYPVDPQIDPAITLADCQTFGIPIAALQICLKKTNDSSLLAGITLATNGSSHSMDPLSFPSCSADQLFKYNELAYKRSDQHQNDSHETLCVRSV